MKIRGTRGRIEFDLENGYVVRAEGEMHLDYTFVVYTKSMRYIVPHQNKNLSLSQKEEIINEAKKVTRETKVQLVFLDAEGKPI